MDLRHWATTTHGPSEFIAASFAFWWGLWIASPGWSSFDSTPTYRGMGLVAPDVVWGGVLMVAAVLLAWASLSGLAGWKQLVLLFLFSYFVFVTVVVGMANISSAAGVAYFHVAVTYAWLWWVDRRRNG